MTDLLSRPSAAFSGQQLIAEGALVDVALAVRALPLDGMAPVLVFDQTTGGVVDLDLRGSTADVIRRLTERAQAEGATSKASGEAQEAARGRGRPKLGVVAREVTLLPRHWEWLGEQPGGASQALRRLVDQARKAGDGADKDRSRQGIAYRFMQAIAGDLRGFEEASRALFAGDMPRFERSITAWPEDVRSFALRLAKGEGDDG
ncbi:DUF2239 family protein [Pseudohoeflea suaedae]|uniref:DUF2239 family protein n=1 Tax=Pseudohoeflea suaedae TaxID=877384 RepID=A0A4R5PKH8_9HYPH|nr:DUF2239 family protein [Pseudohoeflea suaedae]TDH36231.1 DUF2239 family protein [Pseudohoeflea suaedae]